MIYGDYNRTIVGFHGTSRAKSLLLVQRKAEFEASHNRDDWLGHGTYFWEHAPRQAYAWAQQRWGDDAAVVASMIRLGNCFDLLDPPNVEILKTYYDAFIEGQRASNQEPPRNFNARKFLDCAVFEYAYAAIEKDAATMVETCRAVYVPAKGGRRLWKQSWISQETHIQLCVRNTACIMGTWLVGESSYL